MKVVKKLGKIRDLVRERLREKRVRDRFDYLYKEINETMCARGS